MINSKFKIKNGFDTITTPSHPEGTPEGPTKANFSSYILI